MTTCSRLLALCMACVLVPCAFSRGGGGDPNRLEADLAKEKTKVAKVFFDLAEDLAKRGYGDRAFEALQKARELDEELKGLDALSEKIKSVEASGDLDEPAAKRIDKAHKEAAKGYDRMAAVFKREPQDTRHVEYLVVALGLEATKARVKAIADLAKDVPTVIRSPEHPFAAHVSLPKGWRPDREYPVLVAVDGEGIYFQGHAYLFGDQRGDREVILVAPHALSSAVEIKHDRYPAYSETLVIRHNSGRVEFDEAGLLHLLDFLRTHFGASGKVALAGYSRGGRLCYRMLLKHPDRLLCAAAANAHYESELARDAAPTPDGGPPVRILLGADDPERAKMRDGGGPGLEAQAAEALAALEAAGRARVERRVLEGVGHTPCVAEVYQLLDEVLAGR